MIKFFISFFILLFIYPFHQQINNDSEKELIFKGVYLGKNIYIINPYKNNEYCINDIYLNNKKLDKEINSSSFEIDLSLYNLNIEDSLFFKIIYNEDIGIPKIYNPDAFFKKNEIKFLNTDCDRKEAKISWTVDGDNIEEPFEIEQFMWETWLTVNLIDPKKQNTFPSYTSTITPHSGRNLFRIKYIDAEGNEYYSSEIKYNSRTKPVEITTEKIIDSIEFSEETMYQIYNEIGSMLLSGYGNKIDISSLKKGTYILNYDNTTINIKKKK